MNAEFDATIVRPARPVAADDATISTPSRRGVVDDSTALGSRRVTHPHVVTVADGESDASPEPHARQVKRRTAYSPLATELRAGPARTPARPASESPQPSVAVSPAMARRTRNARTRSLGGGDEVAVRERPLERAVIDRAVRTMAQRRAVVLAAAAAGVFVAAIGLLVVLLQTWR